MEGVVVRQEPHVRRGAPMVLCSKGRWWEWRWVPLGGIAALRCCLAVPSQGVSDQSCVCLLTHCPTTMAHRCEHRPQISAPLLLLVLCRSKHNADRTVWLWLWPPSGTRRVEMQHAPVIIWPSPLSCSWRLTETRRYFYSRLCRAAWTRTPT